MIHYPLSLSAKTETSIVSVLPVPVGRTIVAASLDNDQ